MPYGINYHMPTELVYHEKYVYDAGAIREMVIWQLTKKIRDAPHGVKYRLYYGLEDGTCIIRYDNETGKGDHRHLRNREETYRFRDVETLVADFLKDIESERGK